MRGEGADGGCEAAGAGVADPEFLGDAATRLSNALMACWGGCGWSGIGVGHYRHEEDSVYGHTVPFVGGYEKVAGERKMKGSASVNAAAESALFGSLVGSAATAATTPGGGGLI